MMNETPKAVLAAMYSKSEEDMAQTPTKLTEATKEFEIKTNGKHFVKIKNGKEDVELPRAIYVKELEEKLSRADKDIKKLQVENRRIKAGHDALAKAIRELRTDVNSKMDKF